MSQDPNVKYLEAQFFHEYKSERVRISYGPYEVPPSHIDNGMKNFVEQDATMPCHDCLVTWFQADLVYEDGTSANADTGMWLHHTVLTNGAKEDVKGCNYRGERFFASGNERTLTDISMNGQAKPTLLPVQWLTCGRTEKSGYYISHADRVWMMTELMNEHPASRTAILTITYEYIPYKSDDFQSVTSIWLDIGGCRSSEMAVPTDKTSFHFCSPGWKSTVNARIICVLGHLHDGGAHLDVRKDDESVCRSVPKYDDKGMDHGHGHELVRRHGAGMDMSHITEMSMCHNIGRIQAGEEWTVRADYDIAAHPPMLDASGEPEGVMGIAVMYVVEN